MTGLAIATQPSSLVAVDDQCAAVEAWAYQCESVAELQDAKNKLAAIDEYLELTSTEGRGRVAAAMRRLEVRIGQLLGPATPNGKGSGSVTTDPDDLSRHQRHEFRQMAENEEVVEKVISESTDEAPASRRKVTAAIKDNQPRQLPTSTVQRIAKAREMAARGATSRQIAEAIGISVGGMRGFRARHGIDVPADAVVGKTRHHDHNRMMSTLVDQASHLDAGADLIDYGALDPERIDGWVCSLESSIAFLRTVKNRLIKEQTQ